MQAIRRVAILRSHLLHSSAIQPSNSLCSLATSHKNTGTVPLNDNDVIICAAYRSPIGNIQGSLSSLSATAIATQVCQAALQRSQVNVADIDDVVMGNVVSSGIGQAPATQVAFDSGIPHKVPSTTINKVCSSGLKAVMYVAQSIQLQQAKLAVTGGFESLSQVPYYLSKARSGYVLGHGELVDGILKDGLTDSFQHIHMGQCAEACATKFTISREAQDDHALESYRRAQEATAKGYFKDEIIPITLVNKKGEKTVVSEDEEPSRLQASKVRQLKSAFQKGGSVTAANASKLNDGAAILILASAKYAQQNNLPMLARIRSYADAQQESTEFTTTPSKAIPLALQRAGLKQSDVDYYELNEAFSVVALANMKLLNIDPQRVNVFGGAVALGHPLGCSGARILVTLLNVLKQKNGKIGVAAICNGGGGASAMVIERL